MVTYLEEVLRSCSAESSTEFFLILSITIFLLAIFFHISGKLKKLTNYTPVLLTSLGILGTFTGISIGLVNFDTNNIDSSISSLLGGMKTAFFTSLCGMSLSIILKTILSFKKNKTTTESEDPLILLSQQNTYLNQLLLSLGGETDTSLISQIKLLRSDINDNIKTTIAIQNDTKNNIVDAKESFQIFAEQLWIQLQEFANILSKSATETIIEALRQVIVDFNNNLTNQFGDNFKELNNAVRAMVLWQNNYKEQIEQMIEQYKLSVNAISNTEIAVKSISENTASIPLTMKELASVLETNQRQITYLEQLLEAFVEMREKATSAIPTINEHLDKTVKTIANSVEKASNHYNALLIESNTFINEYIQNSKSQMSNLVSTTNEVSKNIEKANSNLLSENKKIQDNVTNSILNMKNNLETSLDQIFAANTQSMQKTFNNIDVSLQNQVEKTGAAVEKQIGMIDQSMQEELNRVMNAMGTALGQISNQFVKDYSRLVTQMNDIVSTTRH